MLSFLSKQLLQLGWYQIVSVMLILSVGFGQWCLAVEPEVVVEVQPTRLFLGESVQYEVLLNHCDPDQEPLLDGWKDEFTFALVERTTVQQTSIRTLGRQTIRQESRGPRYTYRLTPRHSGTVIIPSPRVEVAGETFQGPSLTLEVIAPQEQDDVRLAITTTPKNVYPLQPFTVSIQLDMKQLAALDSDLEPLANQRSLPTLTIPWVNDEQLPKGLQPLEPWERWLQAYRRDRDERRLGSIRGSVSINSLQRYVSPLDRFFADDLRESADDPFDPFTPAEPRRRERDQRIAFRAAPVRVRLPDDDGRETDYWRYTFTRRFAALARGSYRFGPASFKGDWDAYATRSESQQELLYVLAEPLDVVLAEPPRAGRPASYTGAIGRFTCGAQLTPTRAEVGQPLTLTLWIQGSGTLDETFPPQLDGLPELKHAFRVYEPTAETVRDQRRFTYSIRALQNGVREFPALAWSYFDVDREQYVTLQTPAIPLQLSPATGISEEEIAAANQPDPPSTTVNSKQIADRDRAANESDKRRTDDPASSREMAQVQPGWRMLLTTPGLIGILIMLCFVLLIFVRLARFLHRTKHPDSQSLAAPHLDALHSSATHPSEPRTFERDTFEPRTGSLENRKSVRNERLAGESLQQRRLRAGWRAEQRLRAALADRSDSRRLVTGVSAAFVGWVADTADLAELSLTTTAAVERLTALDVPAATIERFQTILQTCDDIRFGARSDLQTLDTEAECLLAELIATN